MSLLSDKFLTASNILAIVQQCGMTCMLGCGTFFVLMTAGIDLSMGAILGISAIALSKFTNVLHWNPFLSMFLAIAIGVLLGSINGVLVGKVGMPPFIVTFGAMNAYKGVCYKMLDQSCFDLPAEVIWLGTTRIGIIPVSIFFVIIVFIIANFVLKRTRFGTSLQAVGVNPLAADYSGIDSGKIKIAAYAISGLFAALAGILLIGKMNMTWPEMGDGIELNGIMAATIGGASMQGGKGSVWGAFLGAVFVQMINNAMVLLGLSEYVISAVTGAIIILAVSIDGLHQKRMLKV